MADEVKAWKNQSTGGSKHTRHSRLERHHVVER
jgi:hypothetical protein